MKGTTISTTDNFATIDSTRIHYLEAGAGEPVLLLHGWPQTSHCWRQVIPLLEEHYTVVAPDLRGLGQTSDPGLGFEKKSIGDEIARFMRDNLGHKKFHVVGHDWGGVVAYALAAQHQSLVETLTIVDVAVPSPSAPLMSQNGRRWHHPFHQTPELPELLITGRESTYLGWFYDNYGVNPAVISQEDRDEYLKWYSQPNVLRAGFEYYRAAPLDKEAVAGFEPLRMPVLAVGGSGNWGRGAEVADSLAPLVQGDIRQRIIEDAGHWVPEEQPGQLTEELIAHFQNAPIRT